METLGSAAAARASASSGTRMHPPTSPARPKILLYSHGTLGLENIRRSLLLGELLASAYPRAAILLVTGSTTAECTT